MITDAQLLMGRISVPFLLSTVLLLCRIQGKELQGSQQQPHRGAVDPDLVKDLVEGQVSLAAALRQAVCYCLPCKLLSPSPLHYLFLSKR